MSTRRGSNERWSAGQRRLLLSGCDVITDGPAAAPASTSSSASAISTTVIRVTDGDTIVVAPVAGVLDPTNSDNDNDKHTVRLLGIDAAEMNFHKDADPKCDAQAATDSLTRLLPEGSTVTLSYDAHADHADKYGRSLAYVSDEADTDLTEPDLVPPRRPRHRPHCLDMGLLAHPDEQARRWEPKRLRLRLFTIPAAITRLRAHARAPS